MESNFLSSSKEPSINKPTFSKLVTMLCGSPIILCSHLPIFISESLQELYHPSSSVPSNLQTATHSLQSSFKNPFSSLFTYHPSFSVFKLSQYGSFLGMHLPSAHPFGQ